MCVCVCACVCVYLTPMSLTGRDTVIFFKRNTYDLNLVFFYEISYITKTKESNVSFYLPLTEVEERILHHSV